MHMHVLCPVHCARFHKHSLQHNQRETKPTSTKLFVCANLFLACARHAPTCACPSRVHVRQLPARALPMLARAFSLRVFAMLVFLAQRKAFASTIHELQGQRQLPPRTTAFASTTKGIPLHNKRHLPSQRKTSTHALKGTCPHNARHSPPQRKAFASTTQSICPQNSRTRRHLPL